MSEEPTDLKLLMDILEDIRQLKAMVEELQTQLSQTPPSWTPYWPMGNYATAPVKVQCPQCLELIPYGTIHYCSSSGGSGTEDETPQATVKDTKGN